MRREMIRDGRTGKRNSVKIRLYQNKSHMMKKSDSNTSITRSSSSRTSFILGRLDRNLKKVTYLYNGTQIYDRTEELVKEQQFHEKHFSVFRA